MSLKVSIFQTKAINFILCGVYVSLASVFKWFKNFAKFAVRNYFINTTEGEMLVLAAQKSI